MKNVLGSCGCQLLIVNTIQPSITLIVHCNRLMMQTDQTKIRQTSVEAAPQADRARQKGDLFVFNWSQYCLLGQAEGEN